MSSMRCPRCGHIYDPDVRLCPRCDEALLDAVTSLELSDPPDNAHHDHHRNGNALLTESVEMLVAGAVISHLAGEMADRRPEDGSAAEAEVLAEPDDEIEEPLYTGLSTDASEESGFTVETDDREESSAEPVLEVESIPEPDEGEEIIVEPDDDVESVVEPDDEVEGGSEPAELQCVEELEGRDSED